MQGKEAQGGGAPGEAHSQGGGKPVLDAYEGAEPVAVPETNVGADEAGGRGPDAGAQRGVVLQVAIVVLLYPVHDRRVEHAKATKAGEEGAPADGQGQPRARVEAKVERMGNVYDGLPRRPRAKGGRAEEKARLRLVLEVDIVVPGDALLRDHEQGVAGEDPKEVPGARAQGKVQRRAVEAHVLGDDRRPLPSKPRRKNFRYHDLRGRDHSLPKGSFRLW